MLHTPRKIDEEKCKHEKPGIRGNQRGWGLTGIFSGEREGKEVDGADADAKANIRQQTDD